MDEWMDEWMDAVASDVEVIMFFIFVTVCPLAVGVCGVPFSLVGVRDVSIESARVLDCQHHIIWPDVLVYRD